MSTTTKRVKKRRSIKRVPLLHNLPPHIQQAYHQELLDQGALFRQLTAASNGVPGPIARNVIPDIEINEEEDTQVEVATQAEEQPVADVPEPVTAVPTPAYEPGPVVLELMAQESRRFKQMLAAGAGTVMASTLLAAGLLNWLSSAPAAPDPAATTTQAVVENDQQLLDILGSSDYTSSSTTLSEMADQLYEYDPKLRDRHLRELQRAFDEGQ